MPTAGVEKSRCEGVMQSFAVLHSLYALGRWVSPPVPLHVMALQSVPVIAALFPRALRDRCGMSTRVVLGATLLANVILVAAHLPAVVDMDWWMMQVDLALLVGLVVCRSSDMSLLDYASDVSRIQLAWFYFAAGFLKLTKYHSDWRLSCSSIFLPQIAIAWSPSQWLLPDAILLAIMKAAPFITDVVEIGIAMLLFLGRSRELDGRDRGRIKTNRIGWRVTSLHLGLLAAIALHVGIMIAPPPNSIANFGAMCVSRLFLSLPVPVSSAFSEVESAFRSRGPKRARNLVLKGTGAVVVIVAIVSAVHQDVSRIIANVTLTAFSLLTFRAIQIERAGTVPPSTRKKPKPKPKPKQGQAEGAAPIGRWTGIFVCFAAFYAIGMPVLGLGDVGMCNMFSHLKVHAGSSHYILPTGILQRWLYQRSPLDASLGPLRDFAGGELRIEMSTSAFLNAQYPWQTGGQVEPHPLVRERLSRLGHRYASPWFPLPRTDMNPLCLLTNENTAFVMMI